MEIKGKVILALPEQSGTSKNGNSWKKREYVLETQDTYPRKVHFDFFGERADQFPLSVGDDITLSFDIESREYNGRWYTSIRGWKAEKAGAGVPPTTMSEPSFGGYTAPEAPAAPPMVQPADENDDLPF